MRLRACESQISLRDQERFHGGGGVCDGLGEAGSISVG